MTGRTVGEGGAPSPQYQTVAAVLAERGMTPDQYIERLRDEGCGWGQIARRIAEDFGIKAPQTATVKFWHHTTPGCALPQTPPRRVGCGT